MADLSVRYRQQFTRCGKANCPTCGGDGRGHGPYWYAHWREGGRKRSRYLGKMSPEALTGASPQPLQGAPSASVPSLRVRVLGRLSVERLGQEVAPAEWQRTAARTLLASLAVAAQQRLRRDVLGDRLFPGCSPERASDRLSQVLHRLRRVLEPGLAGGRRSRYLIQDGPWLCLATGDDLWIDLVAFERHLEEAERAVEPLPHLVAAIELYRDHLLSDQTDMLGASDTPYEGMREHLAQRWHRALLQIADIEQRRGAVPAAIAAMERLLRLDPEHERALERLLGLHQQLGRLADAAAVLVRLERVRRELLSPLLPARPTRVLSQPRVGGSTAEIARPSRAPLPPLVGRARELSQLLAHLRGARQAHGRIVVLEGESGIGKTRLAQAVADAAKPAGFLVVRGQTAERDRPLPYQALTDALRHLAQVSNAWRTDPSAATAIASLLPTMHAEMPSGVAPLPLYGGGASQQHLWHCVLALLSCAARERPVLLVLEDLQWADAGTLDLLEALAGSITAHALLLIATLRDRSQHEERVARLYRAGNYGGAVQILAVRRLGVAAAVELLAARDGSPMAARRARRLIALCSGNPLLLLALQPALEGLSMDDIDPMDALIDGRALLPAVVHHALVSRLDRVSPSARRGLRIAAGLGSGFRPAALAPLLDETVSPAEVLEEGSAAGLLAVSRVGDATLAAFDPPLLRAVLALDRSRLAPRRSPIDASDGTGGSGAPGAP